VAAARRELAGIELNLRRTHLGGSGIQLPAARSTTQNCQEPQRARRLTNCADRGRELRVSGGIGFRLPLPRRRNVAFPGPKAHGIERITGPRHADTTARPQRVEIRAATIPRTVPDVVTPQPPKPHGTVEFRWPGISDRNGKNPRVTAARQRLCELEFAAAQPAAPRTRNRAGAAFRPEAASLRHPEALQPSEIQSSRKLTLVSFQPQEAAFEYPPTALHGTLVSGMYFGATPPRKAEAAPTVTLEEHFDTGLSNWIGGTHDWKVDVAGVRVGSLALYSPSLEVSDYQLEFLTRIESQGVSYPGALPRRRVRIPALRGAGKCGRRTRHPGGAGSYRENRGHGTHTRGGE
jgi:hypothetical protein